jgi:hypothetical protein
MKVVRNETERFIPEPVEDMFPDVAGWMIGKPAAKGEVKDGEDEKVEEESGRKRSRSATRKSDEDADTK